MSKEDVINLAHSKKIDNLGRVTIPKSVRDNMGIEPGDELELFSSEINGIRCICLKKPTDELEAIKNAIRLLREKGFTVSYDKPKSANE